MIQQSVCLLKAFEEEKTNQWQGHVAKSPGELKSNSYQGAPNSSHLVMCVIMMRRRKRIYPNEDYEEDDDDDTGEDDDVNHIHAVDISAGEEGHR